MTELERYRRALERIRDYDAARSAGYVDEWQEAEAFEAVQRIAGEALDPQRKIDRQRATENERTANYARIKSLDKTRRYFYAEDVIRLKGAWVRFLKGDPDRAYQGIVRVKVVELVGYLMSSSLHPGKEISMYVGNLLTGPGGGAAS